MTLPVTDDDVRAAWNDLYTTEHCKPIPPNPRDHLDQLTLKQLRTVLENDRKRVIDRQP